MSIATPGTDVVPTPPKDFVEALHRFDDNLSVAWSRAQRLWTIFRRDEATDRTDHVLNVCEDDGSYRPLDGRTFEILRRNRWYAGNLEQFEKDTVGALEDKLRSAALREARDMENMNRDRVGQRKFKEIVDRLRSVPFEKLAALSGLNRRKPSGNDLDEMKTRDKKARDQRENF